MPETSNGIPYVDKNDYVFDFPAHSLALAEKVGSRISDTESTVASVNTLAKAAKSSADTALAQARAVETVFKAKASSPDGAATAAFVRAGNVVTASITLAEKHAQATAYIDIPAGYRLAPELVNGHSVLTVNDLKTESYTAYFPNNSRVVVIHMPGSNKEAAGLATWITTDSKPS